MHKVTIEITRSNGSIIYSTLDVNPSNGRSMGYIAGHLQGLIDRGNSVKVI